MYARKDRSADRREMLRVKVKSLAEEARIIRREEALVGSGYLRDELHQHRVGIVRYEARHAGLAYGLIRGLTLDQMEPKRITKPNWEKVKVMLKKYGPAGMVLTKDIESMNVQAKEPEALAA